MKKTNLCFTLVFLALLLSGIMSGCYTRDTYRKCEGVIWATTFHVTYSSDRMLDDSILEVMHLVENSLSPFDENSLVTNINLNRTKLTDTLFRRIFNASIQVNNISGGAFDPTVAPLVNLWGFGYKESGIEPQKQSIDSALRFVGLTGCRLEGNTIVKADSHTEFDFSAITKGYGCDLIGEMLQRNGCHNYIVEIGGEVVARGKNMYGEPWRIMIDAPVENDSAIVHKRMAVIDITDCGVATSGNYRNFRTTPQGKAWHTISPVTGRPAETETLSATVIAPTAMMADALATACMALPTATALKMISGLPDTEALLVTADSTGYVMNPTAGFPMECFQKNN